VNVYDVPFASPPIVIGLAEPLAVRPPGDDVTVYDVIGEPPFEAGAAKDTVAAPLLAIAETAVGALGGPTGVTGVDGAEAGLAPPAAFLATTVRV